MTRISIENAYSPIEVDLWGSIFETVDQTKGNQKRVAECQAKLAVLEEDQEDVAIELFGEMFDLIFRPVDGGKRKPSTVIKAKWKADDLGLGQLSSFLQRVGAGQRKSMEEGLQEIIANGRPT
jgi:hypothetical protein